MKKLKLKLDSREMLSKEQMKKIAGGYDYGAWCIFNYPSEGEFFVSMDSCDTASGSEACQNNSGGFMSCGYW